MLISQIKNNKMILLKFISYKGVLSMKFLFIAFSIFALTSTSAFSRTTCSKDWKGDTICTSSGGDRTTITRDWKGDDVITNNRGGRTTCTTDWKGDYVCN